MARWWWTKLCPKWFETHDDRHFYTIHEIALRQCTVRFNLIFFLLLNTNNKTTFWFCDHKIGLNTIFFCFSIKCTHLNWWFLNREVSVTWRVSTIWFLFTQNKKVENKFKTNKNVIALNDDDLIEILAS